MGCGFTPCGRELACGSVRVSQISPCKNSLQEGKTFLLPIKHNIVFLRPKIRIGKNL